MKQFSKDLGNVSIAPKGKWNREQEYERLALVYNACDNLSYVAKINVPSGVDIENREYWQPMNATGYADNNFINLTTENENGTITAYETLEEAVATILPINRRAGATLSFYNLNSDRLDRQAEFELWQFNSTDLANWENKDYWNNIYYNWNVFVGWYIGADALKNHVKLPTVGQYAYVGSNLNDAILYQCRTNGTWTNTGTKVRNYISVVVGGNITIGDNGNWFSDGKDTGIPATPAVDEQLDNIGLQLQQHNIEIDKLQKQNVALKSNIDSNFETINNKVDNIKTTTDNKIDVADANLQKQITGNDNDIATLNTKHESLSKTVKEIAVTGGASTATNVTYDKTNSGLNAENIQDAIDEVSSIVIYDVSARNNGAVFESLQALLSSSNLSTLIPASVRHGGMTIRFIQGSEQTSYNKYMQYRLTTDKWSINVIDWKVETDEEKINMNLNISLSRFPLSVNNGYINEDSVFVNSSNFTTLVYEVKANDVLTFGGLNFGRIKFVSTFNTSNINNFDSNSIIDIYSENSEPNNFRINTKSVVISQNCFLCICINNNHFNTVSVFIGDNSLCNHIKTQELGMIKGARFSGGSSPIKTYLNRIVNKDGELLTTVFNGYTVLVYEVKQGDNLHFKGSITGSVAVVGLYSSCEDINSTTLIEKIRYQDNITLDYDFDYVLTQDGYLVFTLNTNRDYVLKINTSDVIANSFISNSPSIPLSAKMGKILYNNSKYLLNYIYKEAFKTEVLTPSSEIQGKGIYKDGREVTVAVYTIRKYPVTEGTIIGIKGYMRGTSPTGVYAFYSGNDISSNDVISIRLVSNTTGSPKTYYDEICMVPSGATMLAVCICTEYPSTDNCLAYYVEPLIGENVMTEKILGNSVLWYRKAYLASDGDNTMHVTNSYRTYCLSVNSGQKLKLNGSVIGNVIVAGVFSSMIPSTSTLIELIETCTNSAVKYYTDYEYIIQNSGYLFICENKTDNRNLYFSVDDNVKVLSELPLLTNIRSQNVNWNCDNTRKIFLAQDKDLYVTLNGDSVTAWQSAKSKADAGVTNVPPVCDKKAVAYWLYETLKFGNAVYKRFDAGKFSLVGDWDDTLVDDSTAVFTETGTFKTLYDHNRIRTNNPAITTLQTEGATFPEKFTNYETQRNIPMRFSNSANASVTFTIPAGNMKADFIYHAHKLGDNIAITIDRGNGIVVVNDKPNDWENAIEANGCIKSLGYNASAVQAITGLAANDDFGVSNKKLYFKILNTENDTTITITKTSDTNKYIIYWGISYWGTKNKPYAFHLNDQGIGGLSTEQLLWTYGSNILWSYCNLQIFQIPITHYTFTENYNTIKAQLDNVIDRADTFGIDTVFEFPTSDVSDANDSVWINRTDYLKYMKWCILNKNKEIIGNLRDLSKKVWENSYKDRMTFYDFLRSLFVDVVHINDNGGLFYRALFENILN